MSDGPPEGTLDAPTQQASVVTYVALALVAAAVSLLHIEEGLGLPRLMPVVVVGFAIHSLLPMRFRVPFFLLLGVVGAVQLFGPLGTVMLYGAGLLLFGASHLPLPRWGRVGVLLVLTAGLAALRVGWVSVPGALIVLPILASMFMFRMVIYLYDLPHERKPTPLPTRLAYFFMLPNLVFPLFPVVDYQRFTSAHYAGEADAIYRKGVGWLLLGALHILAYRFLHLTLIPEPGAIATLEDVVLYGVTAYLQYLRISGMFHIAVGILCLFGFHMPPTNRWFFLASNYSELWRRINVYWKDFLQKLIYFPIFMPLRKKLGNTRALVVATAAVFVASWLLHAWQWFWLQGEVLFTDVDLAFWALVGVGVGISALRNQSPSQGTADRSPLGQAVVRATGTALLFLATAGMWSLWSSQSLAEWFHVLSQARNSSVEMVARLSGIGAALFAAGVWLAWMDTLGRLPDFDAILRRGSTLVGAGGALMLLGLAAPQLHDSSALLALTLEVDEGPMGYYEGLLQPEEGLQRRAMVPNAPPIDDEVFFADGPLYRLTNDLRRYEMYPSRDYVLGGAAFRTNEHGMRDDPVDVAREPGTVRIALLGASPELGYGVAAGSEFPAVLERRLGQQVEVLNFAVAGYSPVQQVGVLDDALAFDPDLVLLVSHGRADRGMTLKLLLMLTDSRRRFPEELAAFYPGELPGPAVRRDWALAKFEPATRWSYARIAERSRAHGALPVWVHLPLPGETPKVAQGHTLAAPWAREAGLETLILQDLYRGHDRTDLMLSDRHPNEAAHALIAERLATELGPWIDRAGR